MALGHLSVPEMLQLGAALNREGRPHFMSGFLPITSLQSGNPLAYHVDKVYPPKNCWFPYSLMVIIAWLVGIIDKPT